MNRRGPWEGYGRQAKPVVSFPPSFARTFLSKERRLGTRQSVNSVRHLTNSIVNMWVIFCTSHTFGSVCNLQCVES